MQYATAYRGSLVPRRDGCPGSQHRYIRELQHTYGDNVTDWQDAYFKNGPMTKQNINIERRERCFPLLCFRWIYGPGRYNTYCRLSTV